MYSFQCAQVNNTIEYMYCSTSVATYRKRAAKEIEYLIHTHTYNRTNGLLMSVTIPIYCKMFSTFLSPRRVSVCVSHFQFDHAMKVLRFCRNFFVREDEAGSANTEVDCNQKERTDE